jgi:hypothetical protein
MEETGWLTVLEKKGLHQAAEILDNYGINSETDVSVLDRDDFCKLVSGGLKSFQAKRLERWCDTVRPRVAPWCQHCQDSRTWCVLC